MAGQDAYVALREQRTARAVGDRPAPLEEITESQWEAVAVGHLAAPVPLLSPPMLADTAAEAVDSRTVRFLFRARRRRRNRRRGGGWSR